QAGRRGGGRRRPVRAGHAARPSRRRGQGRPAGRRQPLALDVLGGEVGPGEAEEDGDVDRLDGEAAVDVAPQDRGAEQVDEGQPVVGWQGRAFAPPRRRAGRERGGAGARGRRGGGGWGRVEANGPTAATPSIDQAT